MIQKIISSLGYKIRKEYSSSIFLAYKKNTPVIIRAEEDDEQGNTSLRKEKHVLQLTQGIVGIPAFRWLYETPKAIVLAREYIPGKLLAQLSKEKGRKKVLDLQNRQQRSMLEQTLHQAHQQGITNTDLSEEDVLIAEDGRPYLFDWDCAILKKDVSAHEFRKACRTDFEDLDRVCKAVGL